MSKIKGLLFSLLVLTLCFTARGVAQPLDPSLFSGLKWRLVGPFRGGRALTAVGVPGSPSLFYFGSVGGGVWKSNDAGLTWSPIFDGEPIASIGAIAVAPSNPDIIYVGSGEADMRSDITYGDGMYKSTDGGHTWSHIGLADSRQIGRILVDPRNPDIVFVAALGHAYAANAERGVFRSIDGGKTWTGVLHPNDDTGAIDLAYDPTDSHVIYAAMWQTRRPPWNVYPPSNGPGSGLYKSSDGGNTWQQVKGLPTEGLGRIGIAVAPAQHNRVYLVVDAKQGGIFRSDDAGQTWTRTDDEARVWGRGWYFGSVTVDPKNPDIVYVANTSVYKSVDGGKHFVAFKGAPGGDDYHSIWIAPEDPARMILSSDQGSVVSLNGGQTWSSWYNQPTAQLYHVSADNRFPFWIYGAQQDSGAIAVPSRSLGSSITNYDTRPITVGGENGYVAPDPLNLGVLFGGTVSRYDWDTGQDHYISPSVGKPGTFRQTWTLPLAFSPADPHKLYFSHQMLFRTTDQGSSWEQISPDLTRPNPPVPANLDPVTAGEGLASPRKGVIYSIAPSPLDANLLWVGTDDGLIHLTQDDGKHWSDVTPPALTPWSKVGVIEASHFDQQTAYTAIDRHRLDDVRPYIYRTHDMGKSWKMVAQGIPEGAYVNAVREDPKHRGLLFAGTELGIYVSFNDGDDWQPLQFNLPVVSIRDIAIHGDDMVVATHGRSFWVLDDITPLRQVSAAVRNAAAYLFQPQAAIRVRKGSDQGTPYPPEIPHGDNPPAGAIVDYYLGSGPAAPVTLEILDQKGSVVRRYSSSDKIPATEEKNLRFPLHWVHPAEPLAGAPGMHRFVWDMHYTSTAPAGQFEDYGFSSGPLAPPGQYTVRLTVNGQPYTQALALSKDPRVKATDADLQAQFEAASQCASALTKLSTASTEAEKLNDEIEKAKLKGKGNRELLAALEQFQQRLSPVLGPAPARYGPSVIPVNNDHSSLRYLYNSFTFLDYGIESADAAPTVLQSSALRTNTGIMQSTLGQWNQLLTHDLPQLNARIKAAGGMELAISVTSNP